MKLFIDRDFFDNPKIPPVYLCNTSRKIMGELPVSNLQGNIKWNSYSEIEFTINRTYVDILTGETLVHPLFDKVESPRNVYVKNVGMFTLQDLNSTYSDNEGKQVTAFSLEYMAGSKYLNNFRINKGEEDSKEVIYATDRYGLDAKMEDMYKLADGAFDPDENYFHRVYTDSHNYDYEQIKIENEAVYNSHFGADMHPEDILYIRGWATVRFYDPNTPELSLLHLIFSVLPEWRIGHVDYSLRSKERAFDEDRVAVYDFIMEKVCDTFKCICEWDTINGVVNFYEEVEDGINEDNTIATKWDTDVFISRDNLASEISISYSSDDIKTKLEVYGSDDFDIREVNIGKNYIMNLGYYHTLDWMEQDLFEAYDDYLNKLEYYKPQYTEASQERVRAYNKWDKLMNAVPREKNVVLVGDEFKKLYCMYTPINTAYSKDSITEVNSFIDELYSDEQYAIKINKSDLLDGELFVVQGYSLSYVSSSNNFKCLSNITDTNLNGSNGLKHKLKLYHVNEDIKANKTDNYLLRLKNSNSDIAAIRIYNASEEETDEDKENNPNYLIQVIITYAQSGIESAPITYTMDEWIKGTLTAEKMNLKGYTIQYIGTMGAYFVLAKDERQKENIEDYGIRLLQEKQDMYTTIFQTQTEAMYSQEKYQCTANNEAPTGEIAIGTRWLDTDSNPMKLYVYASNGWTEMSDDLTGYEDYQRYIDNYDKLKVVQEVLVEKEKQAAYMLDGYVVPNRRINFNLYKPNGNGVLMYNGETLEGDMRRAALQHFQGYTITRQSFDGEIPLYTFTTSYDPISYIHDNGIFDEGNKYYTKAIQSSGVETYTEVKIDSKAVYEQYDGSTEEKTLYIQKGNVYVVYLKDNVPYVSYESSIGMYLSKMSRINSLTNLENSFTDDQWVRLSPFIKEDQFSDSNFLLNGYESEGERLDVCKELMEAAKKELNKLCQPSLKFSMTMANILALSEFKSLFNQFQLGNFVRVHIRDGYTKRARLLEVNLNFGDLSDFSCTFGDLVSTKSEVDKHAELLSQAVSAGKQVAASSGNWQRAVDKSNRLEEEIANGLQNAAIQVGRASGQAISWDEHGFKCRKLIDGTTDQYHDTQIAIINNRIVFTTDGWKTSKAALGEFEIDIDGDGKEESMYGLLADAVVSGYVKGSVIEGGSLKIGGSGGTFIVHEDGSVQILAADAKTPVYATQSDVDLINQASQYRIELLYDKSTIFGQPGQTCTLTCKVYKWDKDVTSQLPSGTTFSWLRNGTVYKTTSTPTLTVTNSDIDRNAIFSCSITFDETQIK